MKDATSEELRDYITDIIAEAQSQTQGEGQSQTQVEGQSQTLAVKN